MADALARLLDCTSGERASMLDDLSAVRASLGSPGAADRVAAMALNLATGAGANAR
jgi:hypothetical protein